MHCLLIFELIEMTERTWEAESRAEAGAKSLPSPTTESESQSCLP